MTTPLYALGIHQTLSTTCRPYSPTESKAGLVKFLNDIILGDLPEESLRTLKRLRGVPIAKANSDPRPIGIESLLMKMAASGFQSTQAPDTGCPGPA